MASRMSHSRGSTWVAAIGAAGLTVATGVLVWLALTRVDSPPALSSPPEPAPTVTDVAPEPTATEAANASPTPTAPAAAEAPAAERRILVASADGTLWRAIRGSCADGTPPLLERSSDDGGTWVDVTPIYLGISQIDDLRPFVDAEAEALSTLGTACDRQALRTFTAGEFWEPNDDALASWAFIDGDAVRVSPSATVAAPCPAPSNLRQAGERAVLFCDGVVWSTSDVTAGQWAPVEIASAWAADVGDTGVVVAHAGEGCAGVAVTRVPNDGGAPVDVGCAAELAADGAVAVSATGPSVVVWAGDSVVSLG